MATGDITRLLAAASGGDLLAAANLQRAVYDELRALAASHMRRERSGHTLQPTALVHEAYLRLGTPDQQWESRRHFFGAASQAMRRILVDAARRRTAEKRGGQAERVTLSDLDVAAEESALDVLGVDEALAELEREEPRLARLIELRFFVGLGIEEAARALDVSPATAKRDWAYARAWLHERLSGQVPQGGAP